MSSSTYTGPLPVEDPDSLNLFELHRRNVRNITGNDVVVAGFGGSGSVLMCNIVVELGFGYADPYFDVFDVDGTATPLDKHVPYKERVAAYQSRKQGGLPVTYPQRFLKCHARPVHFTGTRPQYVVHLVRDPRDCMKSMYRWFSDLAHHVIHDVGEVPATFDEFLNSSMDNPLMGDVLPLDAWADFNEAWQTELPAVPHASTVLFEDLKTDPVPTVTRMLDDLGLDVDPAAVAGAVERSSFENMRSHERTVIESSGAAPLYIMRSGRVGEWRDWYDDDPAVAARFRTPRMAELSASLGYEV